MPKPTKVQKEKVMIIFLAVLFLAIIAVAFKNFVLPRFSSDGSSQSTAGPKALPEISQPLPSIQKIKDVINNPRLDEMQYYRPSPEGGQTGSSGSEDGFASTLPEFGTFEVGRPNPFLPFAPGD